MAKRRDPQRGRSSAQKPAMLSPEIARQRFEAAVARRRSWRSRKDTNALRWVHGSGDDLPGFVVDQLGDVLVAQLHEGVLCVDEATAATLCEALLEECGAQAVYRKAFLRDRAGGLARVEKLHHDPQPWIGKPVEPEITVTEHGLRFGVRPYDGFSTGLFIEHRDNRQRVRTRAQGLRVLNLFAYTCGYSVAAAAGGAAHVSSVDLSKKFLEWGKQNFARNGLALDEHRFFASDVFDFYERAQRQGRAYDLVILDPPSFARDRKSKRTFVLTEQLDELVAGAIERLAPGGLLLLCVNHRATSVARLVAAVTTAAGDRAVEIIETPDLPDDFPNDEDFAKSVWARVA